MEILVTNDDGIGAPGIRALAQALAPLGNVTVFAPDRERSATGHGITMHHPLRVSETSFPVSTVKAYAVDGTPSDCVKLGVEAILPHPPDIVVAGVNNGPNLGTDVIYSGTVGGALEGVLLDLPSVAVSLATYGPPDFSVAAAFAARVVAHVRDHGLAAETLLNINVPCCRREEIQGVRVCRLGVRRYRNTFDRRTDPRGKTYFWLAGEVVESEEDDDADTDTAAIRANHISVTPIRYQLTNESAITEIAGWDLDVPV